MLFSQPRITNHIVLLVSANVAHASPRACKQNTTAPSPEVLEEAKEETDREGAEHHAYGESEDPQRETENATRPIDRRV
jgi:hypothetical protein